MNFLLCGQTDAGKSSIAGRLLYECGYFSPQTKINLEEKDCWSTLLDWESEEQTKGKSKTMEYDQHDFKYQEKEYRLIDTPGHQLYIKEFIQGLFNSNVNLICIVISTIPSEFEASFSKGTTKEDILISRSLGCPNILIVWSKCDLYRPTQEMKRIALNYCKMVGYKNIWEEEISAFTGENIFGMLKLEYFTYKPSNEERNEKRNINKFTAICQFHFSQTNILATCGFSFILHYLQGYTGCQIEKMTLIKKDGVSYTKKDEIVVKSNACYTMNLKTEDFINIAEGDRLIFRMDSCTIGFGRVKKIDFKGSI